MKSECLAFTSVPHISNLFRDYLYGYQRVQPLYPLDPRDREQLLSMGRNLRFDPDIRRRVADVLERQNRAFGASQATLANVSRLRGGAVAAVSGQQVGLFGGPLYSVLKAVSAIRLARDLTAKGLECVPVFWLATEDHDLAEVNHVTLLNPDGLPERLETASRGPKDSPVSEIVFGAEISALVDHACALLGDNEIADAVRSSYRPGESLGTAFGKLFAALFRDFGLVLLDPSDQALHELAKPIYLAAIQKAGLLDAALLQRGRELRNSGYHEQVKVTPETTLLFEKRDGSRVVIHRVNAKLKSPVFKDPLTERQVLDKFISHPEEPEGTASSFLIGHDAATAEELLGRIEAAPHRFSANVLLRPVVQDYLLPTVAYFGGPAEVAYFAQVAVVYRELLGRVTPVLPRFTATLLDARSQRLMNKYALSLPDLFAGPEATRQLLAARQLPEELGAEFERGASTVQELVMRLDQALERLDPTLKDAAQRSGRKMLYQLDRLRKRAALAELRRNSEIARHAEWLSANLYPDKGLQEREIAGISFLARSGKELIGALVDCAGDCPDHQILHL